MAVEVALLVLACQAAVVSHPASAALVLIWALEVEAAAEGAAVPPSLSICDISQIRVDHN